MKHETIEFILALAGIIFASTGFWAFITTAIQNRSKKQNALTRMVLGLGHEKIIELCIKYVNRGYIISDEYEDLKSYLYEPHNELGGDGTAEKWMKEVEKLPIKEK